MRALRPIASLVLLGLAEWAAAERLPVRVYTPAEGLPHDRVRRIVRDSRGFLWFATAGGLCRFDGERFTTYGPAHGLPSPLVQDILEARDGTMWVGTDGGLTRLLVAGEGATRFARESLGAERLSQRVYTLYQDGARRIWVGTAAGVFVREGIGPQAAFRAVDLPWPPLPDVSVGFVFAFAEDARGDLWIATSRGLVRRSGDGRLTTHPVRPLHGIDIVLSLLADPDGVLWVGHQSGLASFDTRGVQGQLPLRWHDAPAGGAYVRPRSICRSRDGTLWVGLTSDGLARLKEGEWRVFAEPHGLSDDTINAIAEDGAGNLWLGSDVGGAMRIARGGLASYFRGDGLGHEWISSLFENAGHLYVVSGELAVSRFDGRRFTNAYPIGSDDARLNHTHRGLRDRAGEWWLPTVDGLLHLPSVGLEELASVRPRARYTRGHGLAGEKTHQVFEDRRGDIWVCATDAAGVVSRWERTSGRFTRHAVPGGERLGHALVFREDPAGDLWIGFEAGLARYRGGRSPPLETPPGLPTAEVRDLLFDGRGRMWIASSGGLLRVDDPRADHPRAVPGVPPAALASPLARCLVQDEQGRLYVGTTQGIDRIDLDTRRVRRYTTADGLANNELYTAFRDRTGALWFGTLNGLSRLVPEPEWSAAPPPVFIGGLHIAGAAHPVSELGVPAVTGLTLPPGATRVSIDFFGLGFRPGESLRYQYRLDGADADWSEPTTVRTAHYARLAPGHYRFQVRAVTPGGDASVQPAAVELTVPPPLWARFWFQAVLLVAAGALAYTAYRIRLSRLIALERVRTRIASDLHDDIGANLSQIAILSELAQRQADSGRTPVTEPLERIAGLSRESVDSMGDIVWAINPRRDSLLELSQRMRQVATEMLGAHSIDFRFQGPGEAADRPLGPDLRRQVFLIFKEAVRNLVRHSGATAAELELRVQGRALTLRISDNGRGLGGTTSTHGDGQGLVSMAARARELGGRLEVGPWEGGGTVVGLWVPLHRSSKAGATHTRSDPRARAG